jgi:hypothetical protein
MMKISDSSANKKPPALKQKADWHVLDCERQPKATPRKDFKMAFKKIALASTLALLLAGGNVAMAQQSGGGASGGGAAGAGSAGGGAAGSGASDTGNTSGGSNAASGGAQGSGTSQQGNASSGGAGNNLGGTGSTNASGTQNQGNCVPGQEAGAGQNCDAPGGTPATSN